jgi:hypothetical protein
MLVLLFMIEERGKDDGAKMEKGRPPRQWPPEGQWSVIQYHSSSPAQTGGLSGGEMKIWEEERKGATNRLSLLLGQQPCKFLLVSLQCLPKCSQFLCSFLHTRLTPFLKSFSGSSDGGVDILGSGDRDFREGLLGCGVDAMAGGGCGAGLAVDGVVECGEV